MVALRLGRPVEVWRNSSPPSAGSLAAEIEQQIGNSALLWRGHGIARRARIAPAGRTRPSGVSLGSAGGTGSAWGARRGRIEDRVGGVAVSYTHLRAHE